MYHLFLFFIFFLVCDMFYIVLYIGDMLFYMYFADNNKTWISRVESYHWISQIS